MIQNTFKRVRDQRIKRTSFVEPVQDPTLRQQQAWNKMSSITPTIGFDRAPTMRPSSQASTLTERSDVADKKLVGVSFSIKILWKRFLENDNELYYMQSFCFIKLQSIFYTVYDSTVSYFCSPRTSFSTILKIPNYFSLFWLSMIFLYLF